MKKRIIVKIYRSNTSIEAQAIDADQTVFGKKYIFEKQDDKPVVESSKFGFDFGNIIIKKGIKRISFDRNLNKYHGRVKSFAEGIRKSGVEF